MKKNIIVNYTELNQVVANVDSLEISYAMNKCSPASNMGILQEGDDLFISFSDTMELNMFIDMLTRLKEECENITSYTMKYGGKNNDI